MPFSVTLFYAVHSVSTLDAEWVLYRYYPPPELLSKLSIDNVGKSKFGVYNDFTLQLIWVHEDKLFDIDKESPLPKRSELTDRSKLSTTDVITIGTTMPFEKESHQKFVVSHVLAQLLLMAPRGTWKKYLDNHLDTAVDENLSELRSLMKEDNDVIEKDGIDRAPIISAQYLTRILHRSH